MLFDEKRFRVDIMHERVALVTGGARGIGSAICRNLAGKHRLLLHYFSSKKDAEVLADSLSGSTEVQIFSADVSSDQEVERLFLFCQDQFGRLDVLVNNASYSTEAGWNSSLAEWNWEEWQKTIDVDLKGTMLCSHRAYPIMKSQGSGKIINFSSSAALYGDVPTYFYTAAKSAISGITKAMARAMAPEVQVNCVAPGSIATDWIRKWNLTEGEIAELAKENPSGRIGSPEEVAELVGFLSSPACRFITGQTIMIDGGILMP